MKESITKVVFRVDKEGVVFALFPEILESYQGKNFCRCYQHIGQHGSADYQGCIATSKPAKPAEYQDLLCELKRIGYNVKAIKKYIRPR